MSGADVAAAQRLAAALDHGAQLIPMDIDDAPLDLGEVAYADLDAHGWRCLALDVVYERMAFLAGGGFLLAITGLTTVIGNRRRRRVAERMAAPQWRPLGPLRVVVTSDRLLVWHQNQWWPVWYATISGVCSDPVRGVLDLFFYADPPYRLAGPDMASLAVVLTTATTLQGAPA